MKKRDILKGHSPQAYTPSAIRFGELLKQCPVSFIGSGSYYHIGSRKWNIVFQPDKTPHMLAVRFQDGEGAWWWHINPNGLSAYECARHIERATREWKPDIGIKFLGFTAEQQDPINEEKETAYQPARDVQGVQSECKKNSGGAEQMANKKNQSNTAPSASSGATSNTETCPIIEKPGACYAWTPQDACVYRSLEQAAHQGDARTAYADSDTHAYFHANALKPIARERTGMSGTKVMESIKCLIKGGIIRRIDDRNDDFGWQLFFVENVPESFPDTPAPASDRKTPAGLPFSPAPIHASNGSMKKRLIAAAIKPIYDDYPKHKARYDETMRCIREYNHTIEWIIASFNDTLTPEEIRALRTKIIG